MVNVEGLQVGDQRVCRGGCLEAVAGAVLNFGVGAYMGAPRGQVQRAVISGAQSSTGIPLGTAVLDISVLFPFPRESMQLAIICSYLLGKQDALSEITCLSFQRSFKCVQMRFAPFAYLDL